MSETAILTQVAKAIDDAEIGWNIRLVKLVDDESIYALRYTGSDEVLEFPSHDDAYEHVNARLQRARAEAAIRAIRGMADCGGLPRYAAGDWNRRNIEAFADDVLEG